ncbi:polysaccharide biosynthesis protein [Thermoactinomyces sp. CICC 10521]|uniref:putative polysaccharide biosynthesis protein n=1 Tax=Thermoactinomyces sp. CICC 10521 TaxID=2767426 RepID=UPI0018DE3FAA|nr:polysaccharide biosynthesis protein [Thermoactinomyces sp. CICC 10521]MBH8607418.1 polysaccharide biosynthesis protein [Thermoactinomyces sp. CICC 10521]
MAQLQSSFVRGAAILGLAAFFSKILGALYRIPYQNITGNEGMFVYQQVYPLYSVLLILATAGFPTAISKLVSEKLAEEKEEEARQIFRIALVSLLLIGFVFFLVLFFGAGKLAEWMGNRNLLTLPIQAVSFALLLVPAASAIRGFFQGYQNMAPTALSQVVEQLIRVATILALSWYLTRTGFGFAQIGAGAVFGATTGAVGAIAVLLFFMRKNRAEEYSRNVSGGPRSKSSIRSIVVSIISISLPVCFGALVLPLFSLVDSFTIANLLVDSGLSLNQAVIAKGIFDRGQPLIQFASFFATAISLSIVPAVAEARARKQDQMAGERAQLALRLTWMLGLPASVGLAVIAEPVNVMLFKDAAGTDALSILAFVAIFTVLVHTTTGILQGLGRVYVPAVTLLIGVAVKLGFNLWLIPLLGIRGAAVATVIAFACTAALNLFALKKEWGTTVLKGLPLKTIWATAWMAAVVYLVMLGLKALLVDGDESRMAMSVIALSCVGIGGVVYLWALLRFGALTRADLEKVPKLEKKILPLLERWRLLELKE